MTHLVLFMWAGRVPRKKNLYSINSNLAILGVIAVPMPTGLSFLMVWQNQGNSLMFQWTNDSMVIWERTTTYPGCWMKTICSHHLVRPRKDPHENLQKEHQWLKTWSRISSPLDARRVLCAKTQPSAIMSQPAIQGVRLGMWRWLEIPWPTFFTSIIFMHKSAR